MNIKIYGTNTSGHQLIVKVIRDLLVKAQIEFELLEINEVSMFLEKGIESIPAVQLNDNPIICLKSNDSFSKNLRKFVNQILASKNYGALPKLIVPVDFSETSINALTYGHRLATDLNAITKILHVYKPKPALDAQHNVSLNSQEECNAKLENLAQGLDVDWGSDILKASLVSSEFKVGFPAEGILKSIKENSAEFIVMGTTGTNDIFKKWFGSVSLDIMSKSEIPILLVPKKARYKQIKNVMLAVDEFQMDESRISKFLNLCNYFKCNLHIVKVGGNIYEIVDALFVEDKYSDIKLSTHILKEEDIVSALDNFALSNSIDIIAMSPRPKSYYKTFFDISMTKKMAIQTHIPLLVLK